MQKMKKNKNKHFPKKKESFPSWTESDTDSLFEKI